MKKYVLPKDFPEIDFSKMKIYLLEGSPRTLAAMSEQFIRRFPQIPGAAGRNRYDRYCRAGL